MSTLPEARKIRRVGEDIVIIRSSISIASVLCGRFSQAAGDVVRGVSLSQATTAATTASLAQTAQTLSPCLRLIERSLTSLVDVLEATEAGYRPDRAIDWTSAEDTMAQLCSRLQRCIRLTDRVPGAMFEDVVEEAESAARADASAPVPDEEGRAGEVNVVAPDEDFLSLNEVVDCLKYEIDFMSYAASAVLSLATTGGMTRAPAGRSRRPSLGRLLDMM